LHDNNIWLYICIVKCDKIFEIVILWGVEIGRHTLLSRGWRPYDKPKLTFGLDYPVRMPLPAKYSVEVRILLLQLFFRAWLLIFYCEVLKLADIPSCLGGGEKETNVT